MGGRLGRAFVTLHVKNLLTVWVDWLSLSLVLVLIIDSIFVVRLLGVSPQSPYTDRMIENVGVIPG